MTNNKTNRREFIKLGGLVALASALPTNMDAAPRMPKSDDLNYWTLLRNQFPLDKNIIYLNNGTMGPSPYPVIERVKKEIDKTNVTMHYGGGKTDALEGLARFVGVEKGEIALTHNVTEGINIVCWGLHLKKGDEVIVTSHEHVGNGLPWLFRSIIDKFKLVVVDLAPTAEETLGNIKKAITSKTKVIAVPHIPCTIGQVLPVKAICELAKQKNIFSFIDGAHGPGMLNLDLKDMGCDAYASCCHKWMLGPKGTAFVYVNKEKMKEVDAKFVGGYSSKNWDLIQNPPFFEGLVDDAHRYHYGTQNAALYFGIAEAIDFQEKIGKEKIEKRIRFLGNYLQEGLLAIGKERVQMLTPTEDQSKAALIAFKPVRKEYDKIVNECKDANIHLRSVPENQINCIRVSTHIYNSTAEIDVLLEKLQTLL
ncbi:MAG: aminotransferase class V-fold PLP-dependent enzyme [Sediminibacterium sp.]|nr:aminotransferase class V-fold PLP-dependent enzyme [Sediminibacterium sp.]